MSDPKFEIIIKEPDIVTEKVLLQDVITLADKYNRPLSEVMELVVDWGLRKAEELIQPAASKLSAHEERSKELLRLSHEADMVLLRSNARVKLDNARAALNPKHAAGKSRPGTHFIPPVPLLEVGEVMKRGAEKYGAYNWGDAGVVASIYYDAIERHRAKWWAGEKMSPDDKCHHLAHIAACALILLDCEIMGNLEDDRPARTAQVAEYLEWRGALLGAGLPLVKAAPARVAEIAGAEEPPQAFGNGGEQSGDVSGRKRHTCRCKNTNDAADKA